MMQGNLLLQGFSTAELIDEIQRREENNPAWFEKLKKGLRCYACGRSRKAYGYEVNGTLVELGMRAMKHCYEHGIRVFDRREIYNDELATHQYPKLGIVGILERTHRLNTWKLTEQGEAFLQNEGRLPSKFWSYYTRSGKKVKSDENLIRLEDVAPDWKKWLDWQLDYRKVSYESTIV
jgi:hypothetical protein